jgi:hypothetical protein
MSDEYPMHRIIRLKRYEQPPEDYFEDFLHEFHRRQRAELLRPSFQSQLLERISSIFSEMRVSGMAYAGATAVAVVATVAILKQPGTATVQQPVAYQASYRQTPVTIPAMQPVSLRIDPQAPDRFDSLYPASYHPSARAATHDSPLSF